MSVRSRQARCSMPLSTHSASSRSSTSCAFTVLRIHALPVKTEHHKISLCEFVPCSCSAVDHERVDQRTLTWQDVSVHIGKLLHASPLNPDAASDAVQLRARYQDQWQKRCLENSASSQEVALLSSEDIIRFWSERQADFVQEHGAKAAAAIDSEIKFLPSKSIKELLNGKLADPSAPRNFLAINAICFFADGTSLALVSGNYEMVSSCACYS